MGVVELIRTSSSLIKEKVMGSIRKKLVEVASLYDLDPSPVRVTQVIAPGKEKEKDKEKKLANKVIGLVQKDPQGKGKEEYPDTEVKDKAIKIKGIKK